MLLLDRPNFRRATDADKERCIDLERTAYPSPGSHADRERALFQHPLGTIDDLIVAEIDGEIMAQTQLFRLRTYWGGRPVKTGGIASVSVAPEARGRGIAGALMEHIHLLQDRRRAPLTMLYAFRQGYYARLGYAAASSRRRLAFDPRSIPRAWDGSVRRARGADRAALERLFERVARASSGVHSRPKAVWDRIFANEERTLFVTDRVTGYVSFVLRQDEPHAETTLVVDELVAADPAARRALVGALGRMKDQVATIELEVADGDPLERALVDADGRRYGDAVVEHSLGEIVGGPMVRIGDLTTALEARGYLRDGSFAVEVGDERVGVRVAGGRATVLPRASKSAPRLVTTRATLAAILYGGLGALDATALGLAEADPRVDPVLRLPPVMPFDAF
ncbi:MAG: GNAT family N-acetyltransferase [Labilithrix sp.]|nr:GNAT family N-acetyltransferase [Labilithrix sp.]MCW5811077.1 GNAT family N-acetyltransferase [Labilithrix sp.]